MQQLDIDWRPRNEVYALLSQYGVPRDFAEELVPEFVLYWNERGTERHSWGNRFFTHALGAWRKQQASTAVARPQTAMSEAWRPSNAALHILQTRGVSGDLIAQELATFILYWRDRGDVCSTWDSRFIGHVLRAWDNQRKQAPAATQARSLVEDLTDRSWATTTPGGSNGEG